MDSYKRKEGKVARGIQVFKSIRKEKHKNLPDNTLLKKKVFPHSEKLNTLIYFPTRPPEKRTTTGRLRETNNIIRVFWLFPQQPVQNIKESVLRISM